MLSVFAHSFGLTLLNVGHFFSFFCYPQQALCGIETTAPLRKRNSQWLLLENVR